MTNGLSNSLPDLASVTLVAVTSVALGPTIRALRASMEQGRFGEVLLLSDQPPPADCNGIRWRQIKHLASRAAYSEFMLRDLRRYIATPYALCVQWDGYVLDGNAWDPVFLDYDYIGAPWPHFGDGHNVGNGGFSLRSRRLLEATGELPIDTSASEDVIIGRLFRSELERRGIRIAPEAIARRFSYERSRPSGAEFGFHGVFNLVRHMTVAESLRLLRSLDRGLLARNERWELLGWALRHGQMRIVMEMVRRLA